MLRVLAICLEWPSPSRHTGGVGRYVYRLSACLAADVELAVVTGPNPTPLENVALHPIPDRAFTSRLGRHYLSLPLVAKITMTTQYDVIHSHGDDLALAYTRSHPPIVRTYHGRSAAEASSGRWLRRANHFLLAATEHAVRRRVVSVGVGPDSVAAFGAKVLIPPVLPGDLPAFLTDRPEAPSVVFVGGYGGRKRGGLALAVVSTVRTRIPTLGFVVIGPEQDRQCYPRWVDFRANPTDAEVRSVIARSWVLLAPSTYEGFGIPAWEAMGSGAVVLGTQNTGLSFLSAQGFGARIVCDSALAKALESLLTNALEREELVRSGRARAEAVAVMADPSRYLELFRKVVRSA